MSKIKGRQQLASLSLGTAFRNTGKKRTEKKRAALCPVPLRAGRRENVSEASLSSAVSAEVLQDRKGAMDCFKSSLNKFHYLAVNEQWQELTNKSAGK